MLLPHAGSIAPVGLFNDPLARTDDHGLCHEFRGRGFDHQTPHFDRYAQIDADRKAAPLEPFPFQAQKRNRNARSVSIVLSRAHRDLASSQIRFGRWAGHWGRCVDMAENITENIRVGERIRLPERRPPPAY